VHRQLDFEFNLDHLSELRFPPKREVHFQLLGRFLAISF